MLRYLPGILLLQLATLGVGLFAPQPIEGKVWVLVLLPIALLGVFVALWFSSISKNKTQEAVNEANMAFAKERESIQLRAEKAKTRLVEKTHKQIANESRKTQRGADIKVGAAFAATIGAGILMLIIEMLTFGLMTITTAGGALGGYLVRAKKAHRELEEQSGKATQKDTPLIPEKGFRLPKPGILKKPSKT